MPSPEVNKQVTSFIYRTNRHDNPALVLKNRFLC
jgi:hypothetical protein